MLLNDSSQSGDVAVRSVYRYSPDYDESFHWKEAGRDNEATVVLLHGFLAHSMAYRKVLEPLAEEYRVVLPDLPGHGRDRTFHSARLRPEIYDMIDWFECLLDEVETSGPLYIGGHSLGALLAFIAGREQDRFEPVEKLVLISPGIRIGVPTWFSRVIDWLPADLAQLGASQLGMRIYEPIQWRESRMTQREIDNYLAPLQDIDRLEFILKLGADLVSEPDRLPGAHRVQVPTLIVMGGRDHLLTVETTELLNSVIPDCRLEILEGAGHCPMEDMPTDFLLHLQQFLGGDDE